MLLPCSTHRLIKKHIAAKNYSSQVLYLGHTSMDVAVGYEGVAKDTSGLLHLHGKSGLKHTKQILECWKVGKFFTGLIWSGVGR